MNRKSFLCKSGLVCLGTTLGKTLIKSAGAQETEPAGTNDNKALLDWLKDFLANVEQNLPDSARQSILRENGRACARRGTVKAAQTASGDLSEFLNTLQKWIGAQNIAREKNTIMVKYEHCYCPITKHSELHLPADYCQCSIGWLEEMFSTVTGNAVAVQMISSIRSGATHCEFIVTV